MMCCVERTINNCNVKILFLDDNNASWEEGRMLDVLLSVYDEKCKTVNEVDNNECR